MTTYDVTVTREDNLWIADVLGMPQQVVGVMDYENLSDLHEDLPGFVADLLGIPVNSVALKYRYEVNGRDVTTAMRRMLDAERDLRLAQQERERARKEALAALTGTGISQAAIGDALGLSHQRIHQLVKEDA